MEENKVALSEYLTIVREISGGEISPEEGEARINKFFSKLIIQDYMPHTNKMINLGKILFSVADLKDEMMATAYLEAGRVSHGLLSYCINLVNDVEPLGVVFVVCDAIHQYGLYNYILQFCEQDYRLFSQMLSDMINIAHINTLVESTALFNNAAFDDWVKGMSELGKQLTPELLQGLIELGSQTDQATQKLLSTLSEAAVEESTKTLNKTLHSLKSITDDEDNNAPELDNQEGHDNEA